ncbi:hypothetical protein MRA01_64070 [Methylobacterium radiotolerans]|nr:hypothetical protein MRA01_64070 [Methylobacterium radiotolerans]
MADAARALRSSEQQGVWGRRATSPSPEINRRSSLASADIAGNNLDQAARRWRAATRRLQVTARR